MKTVATYIFLVGLPVLGVLLVLRLGQNLTPPMSVGGVWQIEVPAQAECAAEWEGIDELTLTISQSGPNLTLTLDTNPRTTLTGVITEAQVVADTTRAPADAWITHLEAALDRQPDPDQLTGSLTVSACSGAWPFTATRQPPSPAGALTH